MDNRQTQIAVRGYIAGFTACATLLLALETYPAWVVGVGMFALITFAGQPVLRWIHGTTSDESHNPG